MEAEIEAALAKLEGARDDIQGILYTSDNETYFSSDLWDVMYPLIDLIEKLQNIKETYAS